MSGGYFDHQQWVINSIADDIEELIETNNDADEFGNVRGYNKATLDAFREGVKALRRAAVYAQRIDWLVSGDDADDTFHARLKADLKELTDDNA